MPSCKTLIIKRRKLEARDILEDSKRRKEDQEIAFLFPHTPHLSMRSSRGETISDISASSELSTRLNIISAFVL